MICKDCKNNKDGFCQVFIEEDGTKKPISEKQIACGQKNLTNIHDERDWIEPSLQERLIVLEEKISELEDKEVSR